MAVCLVAFPLAVEMPVRGSGDIPETAADADDTVKTVRSIAELKKVDPGKVIETCDLSNCGIRDIPNLKAYTILRMNLSGNFLKASKEVFNKLPRSLRELNVSNCKIGKQELEWSKEKKGNTGMILCFSSSLAETLSLSSGCSTPPTII